MLIMRYASSLEIAHRKRKAMHLIHLAGVEALFGRRNSHDDAGHRDRKRFERQGKVAEERFVEIVRI